jgi:hypothetical protein
MATTILTGKRLKFAQLLLKGLTIIDAWVQSGHTYDRPNATRASKHPEVVTWLAEHRARQERREAREAAKLLPAPAPPPPADPDTPAEPEYMTMARELFRIAKVQKDVRGMLRAIEVMTPQPEPRSPGRRRADGTPAQWRDGRGDRHEAPPPRRSPYQEERQRQHDEEAQRAAEVLQAAKDHRDGWLDADEPSAENEFIGITAEQKAMVSAMTDAELVAWHTDEEALFDEIGDLEPDPDRHHHQRIKQAILTENVLRETL